MPMQKKPMPFAEWRPDIALLDNEFASEVENVFAGVNSYLPFPSLRAFTEASLSNAGNDAFTKVMLAFDGVDAATTITDSNVGGSAHTWTAAGNAQLDTGQHMFGATSLLLDGAGDWVSMPDHADIALGAGDFTIDCWFFCDDAVGTVRNLAGQCDSTGTVGSTSFYILRQTDGTIRATIAVGAGAFNTRSCTSTTQYSNTLNPGWHHLAFTREGVNFNLFLDGMLESTTQLGGALNNSTNALRVGARGEMTSDTWKGWIDEFRISVGLARWSQNFPPPRAAYFNAGGRPCGLYSARTADGGWKIFAGTEHKLLTWSVAGWADVSRTAGGDYTVPPNEMWSMEQSGNRLVAVNVNDDPQVFLIDSGANFAALGGSPPRAGHVKQIGDFLFLSRLASNNRKIQWSGINDITSWVPGLSLSDEQEFPDGGPVQGMAGAEIGYVVQDRTIRTMQFLPGDLTFIFQFSRVLHDRGCISKYGFATIGNVLYFVAEDGFYSITGQQVVPIGADKVNDWFLAHSDVNRRDVVHCLAGVNKPRIVWVHHASSASPMYDRQIIFDWSNGRWSKSGVAAYVFGLLSSVGLDLDTTGPEVGDALLDSTAMSLDSFGYVGGRPQIGAIDGNGQLATLDGPNMPATLETSEMHLAPGYRAFISDAYPLDDARDDVTGTLAAGTRERLQDALTWGAPVRIEITGSAALFSSSRLHRIRRIIPANTVWTHAQGVVVEVQQDGTVA